MENRIDHRVSSLVYRPQNFRDIAETERGKELWDWLRDHDNIVRMETASYLGRAAVEAICPFLVEDFKERVDEDRVKQVIGHMIRQIMEALDYEHVAQPMRITQGIFTTGSRYQKPSEKRDKKMKITREQRLAWLENTANSPFNRWLNKQVTDSDGRLDLDALHEVASRYGIDKREQYKSLNPGQQRMNIGVQLRKVVNPKEYGG